MREKQWKEDEPKKFRTKKSLGQHFLRSNSAIKAMVSAGEVQAGDTVLEIGPGEGVLTRALLATGARVIAVEKDRDLIPLLSETFKTELEAGQLQLLEKDVLDFKASDYALKAHEYKLVANIPYYITGAIIEQFLTEQHPPKTLVLLIQKEVATRIVARDNKESILSLSVKAFGTPRLTTKVPASAFRPAPKVDSAVLAVSHISQDNFKNWGMSEAQAIKHFFDVVHAGFAHKRKLVARNLETIASQETIQQAFRELSIPPDARAEDIVLATWLQLAKLILVNTQKK